MKICLIVPPNLLTRKWKKISVENTSEASSVYQPLGLMYIAAMLEKGGHEIVILDSLLEGYNQINEWKDRKYRGLSLEQIADRVKNISPQMVGITIPFSTQSKTVLEVSRAIKKANKEIITVIGGPHVTIKPKECLSHPSIDFVIIGEGEYSISELVNALETKGNIDLVKGIGYKRSNKLIFTKPRGLIENLDELPFPARHLFPMEKYFEIAKKKQTARGKTKNWANMITSRGCPFNCVFCSVNLSMGKKWRPRSPENVIEEIEHLVKKWGVRQIDFEDDNMTLDKKRIMKICDMIIERKIDIEWHTPNGLRADTLDEELLRKMKDAGCKMICVAPESGNQRVVNDIIGKRLDLKKVIEVVGLCKKVGIEVGVFFVIGFVGETKSDMKDTLDFYKKVLSLGATPYSFAIALPYYGTRLYDQAKDKGYLLYSDTNKLEEGFLNHEALIETPDFSTADLYYFCDEASKQEIRRLFFQRKIIKNRARKLIRGLNNPVLLSKQVYSLMKALKDR